jgi:hypothetical protein
MILIKFSDMDNKKIVELSAGMKFTNFELI